MLLFHPVSLHWLTGSDAKSYQEFQVLLISTLHDRLTLLTREGEVNEWEADAWVDEVIPWGGGVAESPMEAFEKVASDLGIRNDKVGMEVPGYYLHPYHYLHLREWLGKALVAEPSHLVHNLKLVKSPTELGYIREAAARADRGMKAFTQALATGKSELELIGVVCEQLLRDGSALAASPPNLVSGERTAFSHGAPTLRRLQPGDFGNLEFGATSHRYTATLGRQFVMGEPTARMKELTGLALEACDAFIAEVRAGVPAVAPHLAAKKFLEEAGFTRRERVHLSGYGLAPGFPPGWAEPLQLLDDCSYTLEAGMVITVEPPIFIGSERLGARIIDNLLVTEKGAERLSSFPRELIIAHS